jgi:hypothetical protein
VPGWNQLNLDAIDIERRFVGLETPGASLAHPDLHDGDGRRTRQHRAVTRSRMIAVPVADHGLVHGLVRIDIKLPRFTKQPARRGIEPGFDIELGAEWPRLRNKSPA